LAKLQPAGQDSNMSSYRIQQKANLDAIAIAVCSTAAQCFPIMDIIIMMAGCILHQQFQDYGISSADPRDGMIAAASIFSFSNLH